MRSARRAISGVFFLTLVSFVSIIKADERTATAAKEQMVAAAHAQLGKAGRAVDNLAQYLEQYGSITLSSPLFVRPNTNFSFGLHRGTSNYFSEAKSDVNGALAVSDQRASGFGLGLDVQYDPTLVGQYGAMMNDYSKQMGAREMKNALTTAAADSQFKADLLQASLATNDIIHQQMLGRAYSNYAAAYPAPATAPNYPTASGVNGALPASATNEVGRPDVRDVFTSDKFANAGALIRDALSNNSPTVNNRIAMNIAAGDVATEGVLNLLLNPTDAGTLSGKDIFFGVTTVSMNPGRKTSQNFSGEITSYLHLDVEDARSSVLEALLEGHVEIPAGVLAKLAADASVPFESFTNNSGVTNYTAVQYAKLYGSEIDPKTRKIIRIPKSWDADNGANHSDPMVLTVTPGMDVQTLDLESSMRRQFEMSLKLALAMQYAGIKGAANTFFNYAKKVESDARTKTPIPVVNAYSVSGDRIGFQIGPRYQAVASLQNPKAKGAEILHRQWFPAIIILGLDKTAIRPTIRRIKDTNGVYFVTQEPLLKILPIARWLRLNTGFMGFRSRFAEEDYVELSTKVNHELAELEVAVTNIGDNVPDDVANPCALLKNRSDALRDLAFAVSASQVFAPEELLKNVKRSSPPESPSLPKPITISLVEPASILLLRDSVQNLVTQPVIFAVQGTGLKQLNPQKAVAISGDITGVTPISVSDTAIILKGNVTGDSAAVVFQLPVKDDTNAPPAYIYTRPVAVAAVPKPPSPIVLTSIFEHTRTSTTNNSGVTTTIGVKILPTTDTNLLHLIQTLSEATEARSGNVSINVNSKTVDVFSSTNNAPAKSP